MIDLAVVTFRPRAAGESELDSAVRWKFGMLLPDKRIGRWIPARFVLFSLVGTSGVLVHFSVLWLLFSVPGLGFGASQTTATIVAMTTNYALLGTVWNHFASAAVTWKRR